MKMYVHVFVGMYVFLYLGCMYLEVEMVGLPNCFPRWLHHFTFSYSYDRSSIPASKWESARQLKAIDIQHA
jgi:hypothetical protein